MPCTLWLDDACWDFFLHVIIQITSKLLTLLDWRVSLQTRRTFSTPFTSADPEMPQWNRKTELKPKSSHGHLFASQPICAHLAVLEQESELLSHMPTLCSPALLLFPLIPPVNLVLHQLVITRHNSPSTMPLRTNHAPTFQSLWRLPLQCLATNLSTCRRPPFKSQTKVEQAWPVVTHILWSMCLVKEEFYAPKDHVRARLVKAFIHRCLLTSFCLPILSSVIFLISVRLSFSVLPN